LVTPATFNSRENGLESETENSVSFLGSVRVYRVSLGSLGTSGTPVAKARRRFGRRTRS
ncbi:hypothetical protein LINGRAHAP2_LOCUS1578, partial [Linum grandiflorum]